MLYEKKWTGIVCFAALTVFAINWAYARDVPVKQYELLDYFKLKTPFHVSGPTPSIFCGKVVDLELNWKKDLINEAFKARDCVKAKAKFYAAMDIMHENAAISLEKGQPMGDLVFAIGQDAVDAAKAFASFCPADVVGQGCGRGKGTREALNQVLGNAKALQMHFCQMVPESENCKICFVCQSVSKLLGYLDEVDLILGCK